ncbi:pyridoxamine 5'-phosphate oxidase family protein [Dellaglioa sp. P0083]|uniref:pyridoxamine 5'-phosphate oxidase family protein n=1 Tax=Dellaglioa kimchii TaxID=3344667 RepID=UPI0038D3FAC0
MISKEDKRLLDEMVVRERNMKKRRDISGLMLHKLRLFKRRLVAFLTVLSTGILLGLYMTFEPFKMLSVVSIIEVNVLVAAILFLFTSYFWQIMLKHWPLKHLISWYKIKLRVTYAGPLLASKRWLQFYYKDRDISPYIPQILYYLQNESKLKTVDEVLAFIDEGTPSDVEEHNVLDKFRRFIGETNQMVLSTASADGMPASRQMRFIVSPDKSNVWYFGSAPETPKIAELDLGKAAINTIPTSTGMTIASNRLSVKRSKYKLEDLAELYRAQVPGFMDGLLEEDIENEIIYEIVIKSARLDTWTQHDQVKF